MSKNQASSFRLLVQELIAVLDKAGDDIASQSEDLNACMREILATPGLDTRSVSPTAAGNDAGPSLGWLYQDGDVRITRGTVKAGFTQAPHNHGGWNILAVYRGALHYSSYRRDDDQTRPYFAEVSVVEDRIMTDGDVTILPEPPHDIHSVTGLAESTTTLLVARGAFAPVRELYLPERRCYTRLPGDAPGYFLWQ